jgi:DNA-binding transcriptional MerR regulator
MTRIQGKLRSISVASIETNVPVTTLRDWDALVQPHRIACGSTDMRYYDDSHITRIFKLLELNKNSRTRTARPVAAQA